MSESLDMIKQAFETYINDEDRPIRKTTDDSKFEALERVQRAYIILQNNLLLEKRKIYDKLKKLTGQMITSRNDALTLKEAIELNVGMYERADCKLTKHFDHELSVELIDSLWSQLDEAHFPHLADRLQMAELLQRLRQEKEEGHRFDNEHVLERLVNVFKYAELPDNTLQAALMASTAPIRPAQKSPELPFRRKAQPATRQGRLG